MDEPEFSVVIPAYNVQGHLRQAVMSVASEPNTEVVVVEDRSLDGTGPLADELGAQFPSVRVIRPEANVGLGRARNLGLKHARGRYVLFLDGDDYLAQGWHDKLRSAVVDSPDLVIFGYSRLFPNGDKVEGIQRQVLRTVGVFTAEQQPGVLDVLNVAWNKAYKRSFLEELGLRFPVGYYEDIPWTYPVIASAREIVALDESIYLYRQRLSGSILRSLDARHVEIVTQFERLMANLADLGVAPSLRHEIYTRGFRNLLTVATTKRHRVPKSMRRDFYIQMRRSVRALRPEGYALPTEGEQWKVMRAAWRMPYAGFYTRQWLAETKWRTQRIVRWGVSSGKRIVRSLLRHKFLYEAQRRFTPIDANLVVIENLWGLTPRLNCLAIDDELRRTHPHLQLVWSVRRDQLAQVPADIATVEKGSREYYRALARGKYFFLDANLPPWWRKRSHQVFTQLHHGTPLKLMGVEERGKDQVWMDGLLSRSQNWDFSVVSSPYCAEVWKHSYPVRYETLEYGYPRNDVLVNATGETSMSARQRLELSPNSRVILYMPTFRERGQESFSTADVNTIASSLDGDDVLLVRGHYFAEHDYAVAESPAIRDVTEYSAVEDLYLAADVMITDYSSAMFDFANLGRPIIIFAGDWERYRDQRGTYFDITVDAPGAVVKTVTGLTTCLTRRDYESVANATRLQYFREIFCTFETGHAARDVVARVMDSEPRSDIPREVTPALMTWQMDRRA